MIDMLAAEHKPGSRIEAGERPEISNEMCLIEITAGRSDAGPIYRAAIHGTALQ